MKRNKIVTVLVLYRTYDKVAGGRKSVEISNSKERKKKCLSLPLLL